MKSRKRKRRRINKNSEKIVGAENLPYDCWEIILLFLSLNSILKIHPLGIKELIVSFEKEIQKKCEMVIQKIPWICIPRKKNKKYDKVIFKYPCCIGKRVTHTVCRPFQFLPNCFKEAFFNINYMTKCKNYPRCIQRPTAIKMMGGFEVRSRRRVGLTYTPILKWNQQNIKNKNPSWIRKDANILKIKYTKEELKKYDTPLKKFRYKISPLILKIFQENILSDHNAWKIIIERRPKEETMGKELNLILIRSKNAKRWLNHIFGNDLILDFISKQTPFQKSFYRLQL